MSFIVIDLSLGPIIVKQMGNIFPVFELQMVDVFYAIVLVIVLSTIFTLIPAYRSSRVNINNLLKAVE